MELLAYPNFVSRVRAAAVAQGSADPPEEVLLLPFHDRCVSLYGTLEAEVDRDLDRLPDDCSELRSALREGALGRCTKAMKLVNLTPEVIDGEATIWEMVVQDLCLEFQDLVLRAISLPRSYSAIILRFSSAGLLDRYIADIGLEFHRRWRELYNQVW